ncbi:MAG: alpha/beta hydrolase [Oscillospiraceae bacterium]|nr:alpha/beta hydrolase [Oscillospiraceae bacterium]
MLYNARNCTLDIDGTKMDYAVFGKGKKALVIIPGLSLRDVRGAALGLAYMYRCFAKDYTVYVFDRKRDISDGYTVRDIAQDTADAMKQLRIETADVFGVSQGGMVAQYLALEHPELVDKLVLGVTLSRKNPTLERVIGSWLDSIRKGDISGIVRDMTVLMYSDAYVKRYRLLIPLLAKFSKPKDMHRFEILTAACLTCDTYKRLMELKCPVLVLGGREDKIVTGEASEEIAEKLGCEIHMYEDLGHAAYEEAPDFNKRIYDFLMK